MPAMFRSRLVVAVATAVATLVVAGAVAFAVIPDTNGVIHGCRNKSTGALRVIDYPTQQCSNKEIALNWDQTSRYTYVRSDFVSIPTGGYAPVSAACPSGTVPVGAGFSVKAEEPGSPVWPLYSEPYHDEGTYGWRASFVNNDTVIQDVEIIAICAKGVAIGTF